MVFNPSKFSFPDSRHGSSRELILFTKVFQDSIFSQLCQADAKRALHQSTMFILVAFFFLHCLLFILLLWYQSFKQPVMQRTTMICTLAFFSLPLWMPSQPSPWSDVSTTGLSWGAVVLSFLSFLTFTFQRATPRPRLSDIAERLDWVRKAHMTNVRMLQVHTDTSGQLRDTSSNDFLDDKRLKGLFEDSDYGQFREFSRELREASDRIAASARRVDLKPLHRIARILEACTRRIWRAILRQKGFYVSR